MKFSGMMHSLQMTIDDKSKQKDPLQTMYSTLPASQHLHQSLQHSQNNTPSASPFKRGRKQSKNNPHVIDPIELQPISKEIKDKYQTFTNWNYRQAALKLRTKRKKNSTLEREETITDKALVKVLMGFSQKVKEQQELKEKLKKKNAVFDQLVGVKQQRRQRFKKAENPLQFIKHYMGKEKFKPTQEQMFLIQKIIELKTYAQSFGNNLDLEKLLRKIYKLMNLTVDCNQLRFLNLLILLCADICFQARDFNRSFYFYNQSRVASTYANLSGIKSQSLMGMGLIAKQLNLCDEAILIFKKNLQYAWNTKSTESQLLIYDYMGQCYYRQGKMREAQYYHTRYIQNEIQDKDSVIKKISAEMLDEYNIFVNSLQKDNLTSLFIEYLNLPITNFQTVPVPDRIAKKNYENFKEGQSPRKNRPSKRFDFVDFPSAINQIQQLIANDYQFKTQIPNPQMHRNFVAVQKFGRRRKSIDFQQSSQFHRVIGAKPPKMNFQDIYKYPLEKRIDRALSQKKNNSWWEGMLSNTKKQRTQKVGRLKQPIRIGHMSYHKYPEERKRAQSLKTQKIKESFNRTLLDWIDPIK